ncbi:MAG: hypothetical protein LBJ91_07940 [Clostridiales Family XIII bacterium]|nr:hypothetical protein [Clostridiales Family XIII bacterium]
MDNNNDKRRGKDKVKGPLAKIFMLAGVSVAALVFALLFQFLPIGYLSFNAIGFTDGQVTQNVKAGKGAEAVRPAAFASAAPLFERAGAIFGGEDKRRIEANYPLFTDDAAALMMIDDSGTLITDEFEEVPTYRYLYVSDGHTYNADRQQADIYTFILLSEPNGVYLNVQEAHIAGRAIPMNSVVYFSEDAIAYYAYSRDDGLFHFGRITGLGEKDDIGFRTDTYNYHDFLRSLGLLAAKPAAKPVMQPVIDEPEAIIAPPQAAAPTPSRPRPAAEGESAPPAAAAPASADKPKPADPPLPEVEAARLLRPNVHLSHVQCILEVGKTTGSATTRLSVNDRSGVITTDVTAYLYQGATQLYAHTMPRPSFLGAADRVYEDLTFENLQEGVEYRLYGTYSYTDNDGIVQNVVFDEQVFIFQRQYEAPPGPVLPPGYVKPVVTVGDSSTREYYFVNTHQDVYDPAGRIRGGVQYSVYRLSDSDSKVYMRRSQSGTRDVRIGFLPPNESYRVDAYYIYRNEYEEQMRVTLGSWYVNTLPIPSNAAPITLKFSNGDIFSKKIQLEGFYADIADSNPLLLEAASRIGVNVSGGGITEKEFFVNNQGLTSIKNGIPTTFETASTLKSFTSQDYTLVCYDPFGSPLPLAAPYTGTTRTCSEKPRADVNVNVSAGKTTFTIRIINPDGVSIDDCKVQFYEMEGGVENPNPVAARAISGGSIEPAAAEYALSPGALTTTLSIANFKLDKAYIVKITGDFDIGDGRNGAVNMLDDELIAQKQFMATSLSSLGSVAFNTKATDRTDSSVVLNENVNTYATQQITRDLLHEATFNIYKAEDLAANPGIAPARSVTINKASDGALFDELLNGVYATPAALSLTGLESNTEYRIGITAKVKIVDDEYPIPTINDVDTFQTKRLTPVASIKNGDLLSTADTIYLFDLEIVDPDDAIKSDVSMVIRNASNIPVFADTIKTNTKLDYTIPNLDTGIDYTIYFTAAEYNDAFNDNDYTSYRTGVRLHTLPKGLGAEESDYSFEDSQYLNGDGFPNCYVVNTTETISGRITLRGMDAITGNAGELNVKLRSEVFDSGTNLYSNPAYTLKLYSRPGYGEYTSNGAVTYQFATHSAIMQDDRQVKLKMYLEFHAELWVTFQGREIMLDEVYFDTDGPMYTISHTYQLRWLYGVRALTDDGELYTPGAQGRYGRYLVTENLEQFILGGEPAAANLTSPGAWKQYGITTTHPNNDGTGNNAAFQGLIDFQGHSVSFNLHTGSTADPVVTERFFITNIGFQGEVRNMVGYTDITGENPMVSKSLISTNRGRISNVQVHTNATSGSGITDAGVTPLYHNDYGLLARYNYPGGVIENFTVDLGDGIYGRASFGGLVYYNQGIIRNGYVYGSDKNDPARHGRIEVPIVPGNASTSFTVTNVGGVAGYNTATGRVENVYSLADIYVNVYNTSNRPVSTANIGTIVGRNEGGNIRNCYSVGEVYYNTLTDPTFKPGIDLRYGPGVGGQSASARTSVAYLPGDPTRIYSAAYNTQVNRDTLRDSIWQGKMLGSAFATQKSVAAGFFPQLNMTYNMPQQPFLPLPEIPTATDIEFSSVFVEEQQQKEAVALVTLKNPNYYIITGFTVPGLTAEVVAGSQIDVDKVSRVQVRLSNPQSYKSSYDITAFSYRLLNSYYDIPKSLSPYFPVDAEFYKPIGDAIAWREAFSPSSPYRDLTANYRLTADIDLTQLAPSERQLGIEITSDRNNKEVFKGRLDGGYYNSKYELQGMYKISGFTEGGASAYNRSLVGTLWGGALSNFIVDGIKLNTPDQGYVGLVGYTYGGAAIDNVHIIGDSQIQGNYYVGGLVGQQNFCDITNCSTTDLKIRDGNSFNLVAGGIAGYMGNASTIFNSYVFGLDIEEGKAELMRGVGGVVGRFESGEIANVYAQGQIVAKSIDSNIGGLIGYRPDNDKILENCWADVDVRGRKSNLGGLIGSNGSLTDFSDLHALVLGDVTSSLEYIADKTDRPARRVAGTSGGNNDTNGNNGPISGAFAYTEQFINNLPYDSSWSQSDHSLWGPGRDGATMATPDDLRSKQYYIMRIHMGDEFVYDGDEFKEGKAGFGGVENSYLPLLRHTDGGLLYGQTPYQPGGHTYLFDISDASYDDNAATYEVTMDVSHPAGAKIKGLVVEDIAIPTWEYDAAFDVSMLGVDGTDSRIVFRFTEDWIERFVDSYAITDVILDDGDDTRESVSAQIVFGPADTPYLYIDSVGEWLTEMAPARHGQSTENIRIMTDLNFSSYNGTDTLKNSINVKVNRLRGRSAVAPTVVSGLDLAFAGTGMGFVNNANALLQDLKFENIKISQTPAGGERTGIVSQATGTVMNLQFENVELNMNGASSVGMIGWFRGIASDVTMNGIKVSAMRRDRQNYYSSPNTKNLPVQAGAEYVGGFIGYAIDSTIDNVTLSGDTSGALGENDLHLNTNPNRIRGRYMVGGIGGALDATRISNCSVEYASVYSETYNTGAVTTTPESYVGGVVGYATIVGDSPRNQHHTVSHTRVIAEGNRAGGVFGQGCSYSLTNAPTTVTDVVIVAAGDYAGGFTGTNYTTSTQTIMTNVKVFSRRYVGGVGGTNTYNLEAAVRDSVVSTIYDPNLYSVASGVKAVTGGGLASIYPDTDRMDSVKPTYNRYIGGIGGAGFAGYDSTVVNTTVGAVGADYVGGAIGYHDSNDSDRQIEVLDTKVFGRSYVGGVAGALYRSVVHRNITNANVSGSGIYVGGIVGYMQPEQALWGSSLSQVRENIFAGKVEGGDYVGGVVGYVSGNLYPIKSNITYVYYNGTSMTYYSTVAAITQDRDNHVIGNVWVKGNPEGGGAGTNTGSLLYNLDKSISLARVEPMGNRIWEYSVLKTGNDALYAKDISGSAIGGYAYNYGSRDGSTDAIDMPQLEREEPLYSTSNLLLTRDHYLMKYNTTVDTRLRKYNTTSANVGDTQYGMSREQMASESNYVRQIWRNTSDLSVFWYSGFMDGFLPYSTTNMRFPYMSGTTPYANGGWRTQAFFSEGKAPDGTYNSVVHSPLLSSGFWITAADGTAYLQSGIPATPRSFYYYQNSNNRFDFTYTGGIKMPENPSTMATFSLMSMPTPIPEPQVYASAADKLNIEFTGYSPDDYLRIFDAKGEMELTTYAAIDRDVYTLSYDFKTPLIIVTGNKTGALQTEVNPDDLRRTVMTWDDDYYYIAAEGVYAGKGGEAPLLPGAFVNIKKGEAIAEDGAVYSLTPAAIVARPAPVEGTDFADGVAMDAEATPLYHFDLNGAPIDVFKNYSLTGDSLRQPARLLVKDGVMAAIDPNMPAAPDGVILDTEPDENDPDGVREIMAVLDDGGMIADLKEPITLPEGFDNTGIAELSDTLSTDLPIALVRYKTGRATAFNYLTGEEIGLAQSRGGVGAGGIADYAQKLLGVQRASLLAGISGGYQDLKGYENMLDAGTLTGSALGNASGAAVEANAEATPTAGALSVNGDVAVNAAEGKPPSEDGAVGAAGEMAADGAKAESGKRSDVDEAAVQAAGGEAASGGAPAAGVGGDSGPAEITPMEDAAAETGGAPGDAGKPGAKDDAEEAGPAGGVDNAEGGKGGDLSRPALKRGLVSMYNFEKGAYEVFGEEDLLTAEAPEPIATLDYADAAQAEALKELAAQGYKEPFNRGLLVLIVVFGSIAALLVYLYLRKRRLTRAAQRR